MTDEEKILLESIQSLCVRAIEIKDDIKKARDQDTTMMRYKLRDELRAAVNYAHWLMGEEGVVRFR